MYKKARVFRPVVVILLLAMIIGIVPVTVGAVIYPNNCRIPPFKSAPQGSVVVPATDETSLRYLGRTLPVNNMAYMAFPLSGMEFNVTNATGVYLTLSTSLQEGAYASIGFNLLGVWIDDSPEYVVYHLANTKFRRQRDIRIAQFNEPGDHKIRIMKVTCPEVKINVSSVAVSGDEPTIAPSTPRERKIEVVGDSITVSLDIMSREESQGRYNEAWQGYAGRLAEYFDADVSVAAVGGGFLEDKDQRQNAHRYFYLVDPFRPTTQHGGENNDYLWNFSRFTPDIVVVNLGTNLDYATTYMSYVNFYTKIRQQYVNPSIPILFYLGDMSSSAYSQIETAVSHINGNLGDSRVYGLKASAFYPGQGHPTWERHQAMAQEVIAKMETILPSWAK